MPSLDFNCPVYHGAALPAELLLKLRRGTSINEKSRLSLLAVLAGDLAHTYYNHLSVHGKVSDV